MNLHIVSDSDGVTSEITSSQDRRTEHLFESHSTYVGFDETPTELNLHIDLPGAESKTLDVVLSGRNLTVKQQWREEKREEVEGESRILATTETLKKEVILPVDVFPHSAEATLRAGVLHVKLRKKTKDTDPGEKVTVKVAGESR